MSQHGLERHARREAAVLGQSHDAMLQQHRDDGLVVGALAVRRLYHQSVLVYPGLYDTKRPYKYYYIQ